MTSRVSPRDLCLNGRFDVFLKFQFARAVLAGNASQFHLGAYLDHIRVFNAYLEVDDDGRPTKLGRDDFVKAFENLARSIRDDGFDPKQPIPVDANRVPVNGAHRLAACMAAGVDPWIVQASEPLRTRWDFRFFRERGMRPEFLDAGARALVDWYEDLRVAVIFGAGQPHCRRIIDELRSIGEVWFEKRISLTETGKGNLIRLIYEGESWLGRREFGYLGAGGKARPCFPSTAPAAVSLVVFQPRVGADDIVASKERVRDELGLGKHSVHITDTREEAVRITESLFNDNGVHFLNHRRYGRFPGFERDFEQLNDTIQRNPGAGDDVCVVGSAVLAAYGIRDARDLDVVIARREGTPALDELDSGNRHWESYGFDIRALVNDPREHFILRGIKFVSLDNVARLKEQRAEVKDDVDLALIQVMTGRKRTVRRAMARLALLIRLYSNAKWIRSYVGHWMVRLNVRRKRRRGRKHGVGSKS